ncbi:hypothetical protein JHK87_030858 [Glycine soja]|nr:hypothetical protein JHK87_030858 [Glycine soja]
MGRDGNGEHNDRFHSIHQYETDDLTGAVHNPRSCREWVVLFTLTLMLLISVRWRMELWR